jgi:hypothetical protein
MRNCLGNVEECISLGLTSVVPDSSNDTALLIDIDDLECIFGPEVSIFMTVSDSSSLRSTHLGNLFTYFAVANPAAPAPITATRRTGNGVDVVISPQYTGKDTVRAVGYFALAT